jgi:hypothetical protein
MVVFQKKCQEIFPEAIAEYEEESELLKTIRVPRNLMYLSNRLPMANYDLRGLKKNISQFKLNRSINV